MKNILKILILGFIAALFNACGDSSYNYNSNYVSPIINENQIGGIVVDGYISGADVCVDISDDLVCDADESSSTTNSNGIFVLDKPSVSGDTLITLFAENGTDTSTGKDFVEIFSSIIEASTLDDNTSYTISPITDLVYQSFKASGGVDIYDLESAKGVVVSILGINISQIDIDPMKNIDIFAISQDLQHTKMLLQKLFEKHMPSLSDTLIRDLQKKIKLEILEQDFNVKNVIEALEIRLNVVIPDNQKNFVIDQSQELKNTLNALSKNTSLNVDNLNRLQKSIDIKYDEVYSLLAASDENTVLEIVSLENITPDSITQTIFNTTNAIFDESACTNDGFLSIINYGFFTSPDASTSDQNDTLTLRSKFTSDDFSLDSTKVTMFYTSLENSKTGEKIPVVESEYTFGFDESYVGNMHNTIYIMTPKDERGLHSCYRYELDSTSASNISRTKVFNYTQL